MEEEFKEKWIKKRKLKKEDEKEETKGKKSKNGDRGPEQMWENEGEQEEGIERREGLERRLRGLREGVEEGMVGEEMERRIIEVGEKYLQIIREVRIIPKEESGHYIYHWVAPELWQGKQFCQYCGMHIGHGAWPWRKDGLLDGRAVGKLYKNIIQPYS